MKLLRLQINNQFRSLPSGFKIEFRKPDVGYEKNLNEPICLVGVNGSGKSNVLEALAEIFSYLDQAFLNFVFEHSDSPTINSFELEYLLPVTFDLGFIRIDSSMTFDQKYVRIKIVKENDVKPNFTWFKNEEELPVLDSMITVLPKRVIGYSSGQNELLSIPFNRIKFRYYNNLIQEQKSKEIDDIEHSRLKYVDYNENANIFLANYLMSKNDEIDIIKKQILVDDVASFEIFVNRKQSKSGGLKIEKSIDKLLEFLKINATSTNKIDDRYEKYYFEVTTELKKKFQDNFLDSSGLYNLFKRLGYLNLNSIDKSKIDTLFTNSQELYEAYKIDDFDPEKKLFKIDSIEVKKAGLDAPMSYRGLSDGEHQFIHIIGTLLIMKDETSLFLLDEPETHFNPKWKYEYTQILCKVTNSIKSQIILTTHDPVLISGLSKENVIVFNRPQEGVERTYKPQKDLKGMGVDAILMSEIFGFDTTVDADTQGEIVELRTLQLKKMSDQLNAEESDRYLILYEKLKGIDFAEPLNDPMFRDYLLAKQSLEMYSKPFLSVEEENERKLTAQKILETIKKKQ